MILLDGKKVADEICEGLKERVKKLIEKGINPCLNIVIADTNNQASESYIKAKKKKAEDIGIDAQVVSCKTFQKQKNIETPVIFEMPICDEKYALNLFKDHPFIDVDGFATYNMGRLLTNQDSIFHPCTPKGIMRLLDTYNIPIEGKNVTILGRSNIVGRPLSAMMLNRNATVTICHSETPIPAMKQYCLFSDIIISATGVPNLVTRDMVTQNTVVVDAGINCTSEGSLCGDVDFINVAPICSYITPVPKGVGPMTVAMLMENVIDYYENWYKER